MIRNLDKRLAQEIPTLTVELLDNLKRWRQAQQDFTDVTASYRRKYADPVTAEKRAAGDPRRDNAIAYTTYYREQAAMCASALAVLRDIRDEVSDA